MQIYKVGTVGGRWYSGTGTQVKRKMYIGSTCAHTVVVQLLYLHECNSNKEKDTEQVINTYLVLKQNNKKIITITSGTYITCAHTYIHMTTTRYL